MKSLVSQPLISYYHDQTLLYLSLLNLLLKIKKSLQQKSAVKLPRFIRQSLVTDGWTS